VTREYQGSNDGGTTWVTLDAPPAIRIHRLLRWREAGPWEVVPEEPAKPAVDIRCRECGGCDWEARARAYHAEPIAELRATIARLERERDMAQGVANRLSGENEHLGRELADERESRSKELAEVREYYRREGELLAGNNRRMSDALGAAQLELAVKRGMINEARAALDTEPVSR
jgi:hypothetical protein